MISAIENSEMLCVQKASRQRWPKFSWPVGVNVEYVHAHIILNLKDFRKRRESEKRI